jgi:hypothetical protein
MAELENENELIKVIFAIESEVSRLDRFTGKRKATG